MQPWQDRRRSPMLLCSEHYSSWYWLMLVAILDRQYQLPKISECLLIHIWCCLNMLKCKWHEILFDCFGIIIVWSIYFAIFRQFQKLGFCLKIMVFKLRGQSTTWLRLWRCLGVKLTNRTQNMAELASKPKRRGGRYCVAGAPNNQSFQNTLFSPGITMSPI